MELICEAPAKINLYLAIKGKRADGFHDLETRMLKITLADRLRLTRQDSGITVQCPESNLPTGEGNLVHRAAKSFLRPWALVAVCTSCLKKKCRSPLGWEGEAVMLPPYCAA